MLGVSCAAYRELHCTLTLPASGRLAAGMKPPKPETLDPKILNPNALNPMGFFPRRVLAGCCCGRSRHLRSPHGERLAISLHTLNPKRQALLLEGRLRR